MAEHRKAGIASELLRLLAAWFVGQNGLQVCVDVDPDNLAARNFYTKHGATELNKHWLIWNEVRVILQQ